MRRDKALTPLNFDDNVNLSEYLTILAFFALQKGLLRVIINRKDRAESLAVAVRRVHYEISEK